MSGLFRLLHPPAYNLAAQKGFHVDDFDTLERQIAAIADLQLGKLCRGLHQLRRAVQRDFLIPAVPVSFASARRQLQDNVLVRLEFRIPQS